MFHPGRVKYTEPSYGRVTPLLKAISHKEILSRYSERKHVNADARDRGSSTGHGTRYGES